MNVKRHLSQLLNILILKYVTVVAHSFGSAITTYTFSKEKYLVNKIIFLTSPNSVLDIFIDFKNLIKLSKKSFSLLLNTAQKKYSTEKLKDLNIDAELKIFIFL